MSASRFPTAAPINALPQGQSGSEIMVLARDPDVLDAAAAAASKLQLAPWRVLPTVRHMLHWFARTGRLPSHLICDPVAAGRDWPVLRATLADATQSTSIIVVSNEAGSWGAVAPTIPPQADQVAAAMQSAFPAPAIRPNRSAPSAAALRAGLARGEIAVRYQPIVRLRDRRPVMFEALARWIRRPNSVLPDDFVPLAERSGLAHQLSMAVARRVSGELGALRPHLFLPCTINLPLNVLQRHDLPMHLARVAAGTGIRPKDLRLELTETTPVEDVSLLRRAVMRLRAAGHSVFLDDLVHGDQRGKLLDIPFSGFKLDRGMVTALPDDAAIRQETRRLTALANRNGQEVIAEGVAEPRIWRLLSDLGVHHAQGYLVGRPLAAESLPAWASHWRSQHPI